LSRAGETIRVGLVDDHAIERQGLRALIDAQPDMEVVAEACDGVEALAFMDSSAPDVVITEINMPRMNGVELIGRLQRRHSGVKVIVLTRHERSACMLRVVQAGVSAYLPKTVSSCDLVAAVRTVCDGGRVLDPHALDAVLRDYAQRCQGSVGQGPSKLTAREREVLTLVAEGNSNQEIAALLHLSRKTVEVHRRNLMLKLGIHRAADLVKHAIREGLVALDPA
jgi:two-component system, NarL family, response regulator NreC